MKKNISINISGIIFHIEEDAYEQLRNYLQNISRYFASFEDSEEIVADIESRIAEIFLAKLSDEKQVITQDDVQSLIATMGDVKDFQAVEDEIGGTSTSSSGSYSNTTESGTYTTEDRKLYRDESRKIIGGVCSGLAYYFSINPVWVRLLAVILLVFYGVGLIPYILLWILVPGNNQLPEQKSFKKMYRDGEKRVLGGVSSGLAAYFGVDTIVIQLLFVLLTIFGGFGIILYIVLWIILPEARTISEKMQMKGDPVTLTNIETSVKKNLNVDDEKEENVLVKILLFPFRLIAAVVEALGKILGPVFIFLVEAVRVLIGIILILVGASILFAVLVAFGALIGLYSNGIDGPMVFSDVAIPWSLISESISIFTGVAGFIAVFIPALFLVLLGISVIAKRIIFNATTGWAMFALFIISGIFLSINIPAYVYQFSENGRYDETQSFNYTGSTLVLDLKETGMEDYKGVRLRLAGAEDSTIRVVTTYESQGASRLEAVENAKMISYGYTAQDSVFTFDSNIAFKENAKFRAQEANVTMYIPYGVPFVIDYDLRHILRQSLWQYDLRYDDYPSTRWTIDPENGLTCLTCPEKEVEEEVEVAPADSTAYDSAQVIAAFRELEITGPVNASVMYGSTHRILFAEGTPKTGLVMDSDGVRLSIQNNEGEPVTFVLYTPSVERLKSESGSVIFLSDFKQDFMEIKLDGDSKITADINIGELHLDMEDESVMELHGEGNILKAELRGVSRLEGFDFDADNIDIIGRGRSNAEVSADREIIVDKSIGATIDFRGEGKYITRED